MNNHQQENPFKALMVIDRLEVGPVVLRPEKLSAPYRVFQNGEVRQNELVFRYEEAVFDPADPASRNLAAMIAAQVALNYGLFCREIVFHGPYTETDQRFLTQMAENTACEIYVNKFLQPNPFLSGAAAALPVLKQEKYLQATLTFQCPDDFDATKLPAWETDKQRCAILSSGGKDSLLSFGVMNELGYETHAIFGNEAGRHWFTALNAYRYFKNNIPHTSRVWMNSDRIFSWMLRQLPFVKQNFASMRADIYPIRLWTVAVFLFGILPLVRKRGIGRIIIGDEYDSTWLGEYQGIKHYSGLFDQSRYFDNALSYYYRNRDWGITQFSLLRPLSELLIEKTLAERYPELQAHQVSCHAAHMEGERVFPCGKCEKCRRIVGMLSAIGIDPARCGYREAEQKACLAALMQKGIKQESEDVEHLLWMLNERGKLNLPEDQKAILRPHSYTMKLRFQETRSPMNFLPRDLREPIYKIFLAHADGAARYIGNLWEEFSPLTDPSIELPNIFD